MYIFFKYVLKRGNNFSTQALLNNNIVLLCNNNIQINLYILSICNKTILPTFLFNFYILFVLLKRTNFFIFFLFFLCHLQWRAKTRRFFFAILLDFFCFAILLFSFFFCFTKMLKSVALSFLSFPFLLPSISFFANYNPRLRHVDLASFFYFSSFFAFFFSSIFRFTSI